MENFWRNLWGFRVEILIELFFFDNLIKWRKFLDKYLKKKFSGIPNKNLEGSLEEKQE